MSWQAKAAWAVMGAWILAGVAGLAAEGMGRPRRPLGLAARCAYIALAVAWLAVTVAFTQYAITHRGAS